MFKYSYLLLIVLLIMVNKAFSAKVDPTRPFGHKGVTSTTPEGKTLVLESIIYGEGVHTVVISGNVLKVKDYIGEYQLTEINTHSVVLRSEADRIELTLFKNNIIKVSVAK
ncbi:hypothetical protein [Colwellia sp. E150_009]